MTLSSTWCILLVRVVHYISVLIWSFCVKNWRTNGGFTFLTFMIVVTLTFDQWPWTTNLTCILTIAIYWGNMITTSQIVRELSCILMKLLRFYDFDLFDHCDLDLRPMTLCNELDLYFTDRHLVGTFDYDQCNLSSVIVLHTNATLFFQCRITV